MPISDAFRNACYPHKNVDLEWGTHLVPRRIPVTINPWSRQIDR